MNTQNKIRNVATRIMAMLVSAIYIALSVNVPVLAYDEVLSYTITSGDHHGDVCVNSNRGASVNNGDNSSVSVDNLTVYNVEEDCSVYGASATANDNNGVNSTEVTTTVRNNLTVESNYTTSHPVAGIGAESKFDNTPSSVTANVNIGGNTTVIQTSIDNPNTLGIDAKAQDGNFSNVTVCGDLSVTSAGTSGSTTGIQTATATNGTANVTVGNLNNHTGNVTVSGGNDVIGIYTKKVDSSTSLGSSNITVGGDVTAESLGNSGDAYGARIDNSAVGANVNIDIGGHVSAESSNGQTHGLYIISTGNGATTSVDIGEGITTASSHTSYGIYARLGGQGTTTNINVEGNIVVNGDVARGIYAVGGNSTNLKTQVKGDVTSNGAGIYTENMSLAQSTDIIIDGTVKSTANNIPAVILDDSSINNGQVSIAAWKIESNEGTALLGKNDGAQTLINDNSQNAVASRISYIIRVTQPEINNTSANVLSLAKADGTAWDTTKSWDNGTGVDPTMLNVAGENQKVYVKLDVPAGYQLAGVYADSARTVALTQDENGSYYLTVPRGGGIDVNVALTLVQADPTPNVSDESSDDVEYTVVVDNSDTTGNANAGSINEVANALKAINATPAGGTAMIAITGSKIDARIVAAMLSRRNINYYIACFVNGRLSLIIIPAGADLTGLVDADSTINIARLAKEFMVL